MIRRPCPIPTCGWFHSHVATPLTADVPIDILTWTPLNWADMAERTGPGLTDAQVIAGHLATHSYVQWMALARNERRRAEDAEDALDRLLDVLEQSADVVAGAHPVTSMRLPSRAEVESARESLAGVVGGGVDVEA